MEMEMLQAMFMEELKLGDSPKSFSIDLYPETGGENHVVAELHVSYPDRYPEELPELRVVGKEGLSDEMCAAAQGELLAMAADLAGTAMIWPLAEHLQGWLREHNKPREANMHDEMMSRMASKGGAGADRAADDADEDEHGDDEGSGGGGGRTRASDVDERKMHDTYTPVTAESFAEWRKAYDARMRAADDSGPTAPGALLAMDKLTGRQIFESGRLGAADDGGGDADANDGAVDADYTRRESDEEEDAADASGVQAVPGSADGGVTIDESLFVDDDDVPDEDD